jgi:hypothetical protein
MTTAEQIRELLEKMSEERARLLSAAAALDDAAASAVPVGKTGEGEWTVKEQLAHLAEMELGYDGWVARALEADNPDISGVPAPVAAIPLERANEHTVEQLLAVMARERQDTFALIKRLTPEQFERSATHRMFGTLTVIQWLRSFYRHDRMHADQIAGREPEYRPRFTGAEPNQRAARLARTAGDGS